MLTPAVSKPVAVSAGRVSYIGSVYKFGYNAAVSSTEETVWFNGGLYSYPSSAIQMKVSSSDANDTASGGGGTGARTVRVVGLDGDYSEVQEDVSLDGQTAVLTTTKFIRIFRAYVLTAGSGETAAGTVYVGTGTVTNGVPATIYANLGAGNQTQQAVYTVPAGKTGYMFQ